MKFCPYCGVSLPGNAASFCPECGTPLPIQNGAGARRPERRTSQQRPKPSSQRRPRAIDPRDVNYDGYYDDVQPVDAGKRGDRRDPALIKQVALVILGAVGAITLAIILMLLL